MTYEAFRDKFQISLNEQQERAVQCVDGPVLLLAVPGSGKTTVLVSRLGYLIYGRGILPEQILTVTYTVAATRDMKKRFLDKFGPEYGSRLEFRTINGLSQKILQYFGQVTGKKAFDIADQETKGIIQSAFLKVTGQYATENDIKEVQTGITYVKNMRLDQEEILAMEKNIEGFSEIYRLYNQALRELQRIDYDDQMVYALQILKQYPEVLSYFQDKFQYLCVDEAQDTSRIQHDIIHLLAGSRRNLFMVGDEDQSIYGFRAAYPQALVSFEKIYPGAETLLMETNYRSRSEIVEMADRLIQRNKNRHSKQMKPFRAAGGTVQRINCRTRRDQYAYLLKMAKDCRQETAVLYRNHESALPLIDLLDRSHIPYTLKQSDMTFFSHPVVRDIIDFMQLALNPCDEEAFLRIYYKMGAGITKIAAMAAAEQMHQTTETHKETDMHPSTSAHHLDFLEILMAQKSASDFLKNKCRMLRIHFSRMKQDVSSRAVGRILQNMGYADYMENRNMDAGKAEILRMLAENEPGLEKFLARLVQLKEIVSNGIQDQSASLLLSTIHSSKGLEYERVFLTDMVDGVLPGSKEPDPADATEKELNEYEEERRLYYVGMTRAKETLCIFCFTDGRTSQFTREALQMRESEAHPQSQDIFRDRFRASSSPLPATRKQKLSLQEMEEKRKEFEIGVIVRHKKFGRGAIAEVNGDTAKIVFEDGIEKQILLSIAIENNLLQTE